MEKPDAIIPVSYFAPISHVVLHRKYNTWIELEENYQKGSFRNKCQILGANGPLVLSVPLNKGKTKSHIRDVKINYHEDWVRLHLRSFRSAYGTSAYFDHYFPDIETILKHNFTYLTDLNCRILDWLEELQLIRQIKYAEEFIFPEDFEGIDLRYSGRILYTETMVYEQVFSNKYGFVADLSILDLIFNTGPEASHFISKLEPKLIYESTDQKRISPIKRPD